MSAKAGTATPAAQQQQQRRGSANSGTIAAVRELKESLTKELSRSTGAFSTERCLDVLRRLEEMPVNLAVLSETLIGTTVSKLKSHSDEELAAASRSLVKKWKKLAKDSGVGAKAPNGSHKDKDAKPQATARNEAQSQQRRSSTGSQTPDTKPGTGGVPEEWLDLPQLRQNIRVKMREMLLMSVGESEDFSAKLCNQRSEEVEVAIQSQSRGEKAAYTDKARKLGFNLKKNADLRVNILSGHVPADKLVTMSNDELATSAKAQARATLVESLNESRRLDWEQANEDKINQMCGIKGDLLKASLFTCSRCKSHKTTSTQKQTRSADEPMTVFVLCTNCGNRWKC